MSKTVVIKMKDELPFKFTSLEDLYIWADREFNLLEIQNKKCETQFACDLDRVDYVYKGLLETPKVMINSI